MVGRHGIAGDAYDIEFYCERVGISREDIDRLKRPTYNAAPGQAQPVVVQERGGRNRVMQFTWGLRSRDGKGPTPINAKGETIWEIGMFRRLLVRSRCLVPSSGWYEWRDRQPYFLRPAGLGPLFSFAGLFDAWLEDGRVTGSYCVITVAAKPEIRDIHNRMPAILHPDEEAIWLSRRTLDPRRLTRLLRPYEEHVAFHPVSRKVNNPKADGPELIAQVDAPRLLPWPSEHPTKDQITMACYEAEMLIRRRIGDKHLALERYDPLDLRVTSRPGGWFVVGQVVAGRYGASWRVLLQPMTNRVQPEEVGRD